MAIPSALEASLWMVGETMRDAADDWWVIAGAAAALHGAGGPEVGDVDVLASDRDASALLGKLGLQPVQAPPHPLFQSRILGRWTAPPMTVEIMAGFRIRDGSAWREVWPRTRRRMAVRDTFVFAPSADELADLLRLVGRPKDLERARLLAADRGRSTVERKGDGSLRRPSS